MQLCLSVRNKVEELKLYANPEGYVLHADTAARPATLTPCCSAVAQLIFTCNFHTSNPFSMSCCAPQHLVRFGFVASVCRTQNTIGAAL